MPTKFQHKRSTTPGAIPTITDLANAELGINLPDKKIYTAANSSTIIELSSGPVGGTNTQIQFNNSNSFGASAGLTFNYTTNTFNVSNTITIGSNVSLSTGIISIGNSTVNTSSNSTTFNINGKQIAPKYINTFSSSGTWTTPLSLFDANVTYVLIEMWAGGGSGGAWTGGGGGGGAYSWDILPLAVFTATCTVTVGAGGVASNASNSGSSGGYSEVVVNSNYSLRAYGGSGGTTGTGSGLGGHGGSPYVAPSSNNAKTPIPAPFIDMTSTLDANNVLTSVICIPTGAGVGYAHTWTANVPGIQGFGGGGGTNGMLGGNGMLSYDGGAGGGGAGRSTGAVSPGGISDTGGFFSGSSNGAGGSGGNNSTFPTNGTLYGGGGGGGSANATLGRASAAGANGFVRITVF